MSDHQYGRPIVTVKRGGEVLHGACERLDLPILNEQTESADVTCSFYRLPEGARLTRHVHHGRTEVWSLVTGQVRIEYDNHPVEVEAPASVITPDGISHAMQNIGKSDAVFFAMATPKVQKDSEGRNVGTTELE